MNHTLFKAATMLLLAAFAAAAYVGIGLWSLVLYAGFYILRHIARKEDEDARKQQEDEDQMKQAVVKEIVSQMKERRRQRELQQPRDEAPTPRPTTDQHNGQDGPASFL